MECLFSVFFQNNHKIKTGSIASSCICANSVWKFLIIFNYSLFCKPLSFSLPWYANMTFYSFVQVEHVYKKTDRFALSILNKCWLTCFTPTSKCFTGSFVPIHNSMTNFSSVSYRVGYQTLELYCKKTGQALILECASVNM